MKKLGAEHENLDNKVYRQLKSLILDQKLMPGSKIYQEKLAEDMGISRTPLVNALKRLEQEQLITAVPRRGFYIRKFTKEEMIGIFELREVLEGLAARRVARRVSQDQVEKLRNFFKAVRVADDVKSVEKYAEEDRRFHNFLIEIGGDDLMVSILGTYRVIAFSYLVSFRGGLVRSPRETLPEHLKIIGAILARDGRGAEEAIRVHFQRSRDRLVTLLEANGGLEPKESCGHQGGVRLPKKEGKGGRHEK